MVQRSAPSDLIFVGISSVKLIFGCVMNVKFGKILLRLLDTEYHVTYLQQVGSEAACC